MDASANWKTYARFYLKYIEPSKDAIDDGSYAFVSLSALEGWETVMGYAFENLIVEADDFFDSIVPVQDLMGLSR